MKKISIVFFLFFIGILTNQAQSKLDQYSAVLIPKQFNFQTEPGEYNLNKILKSSLIKYNFKAYINGENIPKDIDPCDVLHLDIAKKGLLSNKMKLVFNDCYGQEIYTSVEGKSRIKEFDKSYFEAIGQALKDPKIVNHKYVPSKKIAKAPKVTPTPVSTPKVITEPKPIAAPKTSNAIVLELRGQLYKLVEKEKNNYNVYKKDELIGTLQKQSGENYQMKAGSLSGAGKFDDFGNFILTRVNPANQAIITDTLVRIN